LLITHYSLLITHYSCHNYRFIPKFLSQSFLSITIGRAPDRAETRLSDRIRPAESHTAGFYQGEGISPVQRT
ncbi:MAG: hypothetical protein LBG73_04705, partial [Spirochaetaceae bacterium]|nr:hypothetical protein [Spirochaetaceae bacterium]